MTAFTRPKPWETPDLAELYDADTISRLLGQPIKRRKR